LGGERRLAGRKKKDPKVKKAESQFGGNGWDRVAREDGTGESASSGERVETERLGRSAWYERAGWTQHVWEKSYSVPTATESRRGSMGDVFSQ